MERLSLVLTAVFTGVSALASVVVAAVSVVSYLKRLREDRPVLEAFTRFKPEKSYRSGKAVISIRMTVVNSGKVPLHVVEWLPVDPSDKLDVSPSLRHQTLDPGTLAEGSATLFASEDPETVKLLFVRGDCHVEEVVVEDRSYYRSAAEAADHVPISVPVFA